MKNKKRSTSGASAVEDLNPTPYNPRQDWSAKQAEAFKRSLKKYGDLSGVIFNVTSGHLVGGNKRVEAFKLASDVKITKTTLPKPDSTGTIAYGHVMVDGARFSYREVRWDVRTEKEANIAANKWGAEWDMDALTLMVKELGGESDLEAVGFERDEIDSILKEVETPAAFNVADENIAVQHKCPKCGYTWSGKPS